MKLPQSRRVLSVLGLVLGLLAVGATASARKVLGEDMAPTIAPGEWVFLLPVPIIRGDVVAVKDPLDPARTVLRRAYAGPGNEVSYEDGTVRVGIKKIRQKEMGTLDAWRVLEETVWSKPPARANLWLIRRYADNVRWKMDRITVPDGHWFLLADDRDGALDSRWWGTVPEDDILGVVRARVGTADQWRPAMQWMKPVP